MVWGLYRYLSILEPLPLPFDSAQGAAIAPSPNHIPPLPGDFRERRYPHVGAQGLRP